MRIANALLEDEEQKASDGETKKKKKRAKKKGKKNFGLLPVLLGVCDRMSDREWRRAK